MAETKVTNHEIAFQDGWFSADVTWTYASGTGIQVEHNQDGTHSDVTATTVTTSGNADIGGNITVDGTSTLTGNVSVTGTLRSTPRISTTASTTTLAPNIDNYNIYDVTALAAGLTISNPTGTPNNGDVMVIRIKDDGTTRSLSFGGDFSNISGLTLPSATTVSKWHTFCCLYSSTAAKWQILGVTEEA